MRKQLKDVVVGDVLSLDVYHMDARPHKVISVNRGPDLFGNDSVDFYVSCDGQKFTTFSMNPEDYVHLWEGK